MTASRSKVELARNAAEVVSAVFHSRVCEQPDFVRLQADLAAPLDDATRDELLGILAYAAGMFASFVRCSFDDPEQVMREIMLATMIHIDDSFSND